LFIEEATNERLYNFVTRSAKKRSFTS